MSCFAGLLGGKRKASSKGKSRGAYAKKGNGNDCPKVKPVESMDMADAVDVSGAGDDSAFVVHAAAELSRRGSHEPGDEAAIKIGADLEDAGAGSSSGYDSSDETAKTPKSGGAEPGAGGSSSVGRVSAKLKRSCSNIETARSAPRGGGLNLDLPARSRSYNDLRALRAGRGDGRSATPSRAADASPTASFRTSCSADRVMLKKRSSRQVLPSRSRKLWWRLFLWSHRGLHRPPGATATVPAALASARTQGAGRQHDGYTSDTLDAVTVATGTDAKNKGVAVEESPVQSQWAAFSADASSLDPVSAWVNSLGNVSFHAADEDAVTAGHHDDDDDEGAARPQCSEIVELPVAGRRQPQPKRRAADEAAQASSVVLTLNAFSSVAHISGMGLKAVPSIAAFSTLRAVNLSGNLIVQITAGSLPKGLHSLDLSRNKIGVIEGLRELTRLRVLNLSYNRIARIGHGLSSCTSIRELYLGGNKISDVEGLHRLLKLAVLDVSFNKITTAKSLGQLVANYASLRALNLLGNPVQANTGDDTLRKAVTGLLPRLEYLSKQPVKPQRAREVAKDSVAQAALGNNAGGWSSRRRLTRRVSQSPGGGSSAKISPRGRDGSSGRRGSRSNSKTRQHQHQGSSMPRR